MIRRPALPPEQLRQDMPLFDGATYRPSIDGERLKTLQERVSAFMASGSWHTLSEIQAACGGSEASCSARLRDLRKERHGSKTVERRRRGDPRSGLFEYRVVR